MKAAMRNLVTNRPLGTAEPKVISEDDDSFFTPSPLLANPPYSQGGGIGDDVLIRTASSPQGGTDYVRSSSTLDLAGQKVGGGFKDAHAQVSKVASAARAKLGPSLQQAGQQMGRAGHKVGASLDASGKRMSAFVTARRERKMGPTTYPGSTKPSQAQTSSPNLLSADEESTEYLDAETGGQQYAAVLGATNTYRRASKPHESAYEPGSADTTPSATGPAGETGGLYDSNGPSRYEPPARPTSSSAIVSRINSSFSASQTSLSLVASPAAELPPRSNSSNSWYSPPLAPGRKSSGGPHNSAAYPLPPLGGAISGGGGGGTAAGYFSPATSPEPSGLAAATPSSDYDSPAARYAAAEANEPVESPANLTPIASPVSQPVASPGADSLASLPKSVSSARIAGPDRMLRRPARVSVCAPTLPPFMMDELRNAETAAQPASAPAGAPEVAGNPLLGVLTGGVPLPPPSPTADHPRNASQGTGSTTTQTDESVESASSAHSGAGASIASLLAPRGASLEAPGNPLFAASRNFSAASDAAAAAAASASASTAASEAASESAAPSSASVSSAHAHAHVHALAPVPTLLSADEEPNYDGPPPHSPPALEATTTPMAEAQDTPVAVQEEAFYDAPPSHSPAPQDAYATPPSGISPALQRAPLPRNPSSFSPADAADAASILSHHAHAPSPHADEPGPPPYVAPTGVSEKLSEKAALMQRDALAQAQAQAQTQQTSGRSALPLPPVPVPASSSAVPTGQAWAQDHAPVASSSGTSHAATATTAPSAAEGAAGAGVESSATSSGSHGEAGASVSSGANFSSIAAPSRRTSGAPAPLGGPLFAGAAVGLAAASSQTSEAPSSWKYSTAAPKLELGPVDVGFGERDSEWEWLSRGGKATPLSTPAPPKPLTLADVADEPEGEATAEGEAAEADAASSAPSASEQSTTESAELETGLTFDTNDADFESPFAQSSEAVAMEDDMAALLAAMEHAQHLIRHTNTPKPPIVEQAAAAHDGQAEEQKTRRLLPVPPTA